MKDLTGLTLTETNAYLAGQRAAICHHRTGMCRPNPHDPMHDWNCYVQWNSGWSDKRHEQLDLVSV